MSWDIQLATSYSANDTCRFVKDGSTRFQMAVGSLYVGTPDGSTVGFYHRGSGIAFLALKPADITVNGLAYPTTAATLDALMASGCFSLPASGTTPAPGLAGIGATTLRFPHDLIYWVSGYWPVFKPLILGMGFRLKGVVHTLYQGTATFIVRVNGDPVTPLPIVANGGFTNTVTFPAPFDVIPGQDVELQMQTVGTTTDAHLLHLVWDTEPL